MRDPQEYAARVDAWSRQPKWRAEADRLVRECLAVSQSHSPYALDVGTNTGTMFEVMNNLGLEPIGCDPNFEARRLAATRYGREVHGNIEEAARYLRGYRLGVITMSHVLGHAEDPKALLEEASRYLGAFGAMGLILPNPIYDTLMRPMNRMTGYQTDQTIRHMIGLRRLRKLLPGTMRIRKVWYDGEQPAWMPQNLTLPWTRSRLGVVITRNWSMP